MALNKPLLRSLAVNVNQILDIFLDNKPDSQQIPQLLAEAFEISSQIGQLSPEDRNSSLAWVGLQVGQIRLEK